MSEEIIEEYRKDFGSMGLTLVIEDNPNQSQYIKIRAIRRRDKSIINGPSIRRGGDTSIENAVEGFSRAVSTMHIKPEGWF